MIILEKIKTGIIIALLILLSVTSLSSYLLYQTNKNLTEDKMSLTQKLETCQGNFDKLKEQKKVADDTLDSLLSEQKIVKDEFDSLKEKFGEIKCKTIIKREVKKNVESNQVDTSVDDVADDIRSVGLLLERATCRANSNCIAPESPSK